MTTTELFEPEVGKTYRTTEPVPWRWDRGAPVTHSMIPAGTVLECRPTDHGEPMVSLWPVDNTFHYFTHNSPCWDEMCDVLVEVKDPT